MRREKRRIETDESRQLLAEVEVHQLASVTPEGLPILRQLNGVLVDDWLLFHGAIAGEKSACLGQKAVVSAYETVCDVPSYFTDPHKACPATTYYLSAQAKGMLRNVEQPELKARMLQKLMEKLQPEAGYVALTDPGDLYKKDLRSVRVFGLQIEEITGKANVGQDKPAELVEGIVRGLWTRGKTRDLSAIEKILSLSPKARPSEWRAKPVPSLGELRIVVSPRDEWRSEHALLVRDQYWRESCMLDDIHAALAQSSAWIGIVSESGELVAAGRANGDGHWNARILDVVVRQDLRGLGLGKKLVKTLLDHPRVRHCQSQSLGTKDAQPFYRSLGFNDVRTLKREFPICEMLRRPRLATTVRPAD